MPNKDEKKVPLIYGLASDLPIIYSKSSNIYVWQAPILYGGVAGDLQLDISPNLLSAMQTTQ